VEPRPYCLIRAQKQNPFFLARAAAISLCKFVLPLPPPLVLPLPLPLLRCRRRCFFFSPRLPASPPLETTTRSSCHRRLVSHPATAVSSHVQPPPRETTTRLGPPFMELPAGKFSGFEIARFLNETGCSSFWFPNPFSATLLSPFWLSPPNIIVAMRCCCSFRCKSWLMLLSDSIEEARLPWTFMASMVCRVCIALFKGSESEALSDLRRAQRSGLGGTRPKRGFETAAAAGGSSWKADKAEREVVEKKEAHMASSAS